jgi:hypothetical protein
VVKRRRSGVSKLPDGSGGLQLGLLLEQLHWVCSFHNIVCVTGNFEKALQNGNSEKNASWPPVMLSTPAVTDTY